MRKEGKTQTVIIVLLVITIICMSVGFAAAAFSQTLNINGEVTANKAVWDVHFTNFAEKTGTGYVADKGSITGTGDTSVTYEVALNPGEKYGFTVDATNAGTLEAKLVKVEISGDSISADESKFLSYSVKVDNTAYTTTTDGLSDALAAGASHTVEVEVDYNIPTDPTDLPEDDVEKTFTVKLYYESVLQTGS